MWHPAFLCRAQEYCGNVVVIQLVDSSSNSGIAFALDELPDESNHEFILVDAKLLAALLFVHLVEHSTVNGIGQDDAFFFCGQSGGNALLLVLCRDTNHTAHMLRERLVAGAEFDNTFTCRNKQRFPQVFRGFMQVISIIPEMAIISILLSCLGYSSLYCPLAKQVINLAQYGNIAE